MHYALKGCGQVMRGRPGRLHQCSQDATSKTGKYPPRPKKPLLLAFLKGPRTCLECKAFDQQVTFLCATHLLNLCLWIPGETAHLLTFAQLKVGSSFQYLQVRALLAGSALNFSHSPQWLE